MSQIQFKVCLSQEVYRKFKVFCAINDVTMTTQLNSIVKQFVDKQSETIKIINTKKE